MHVMARERLICQTGERTGYGREAARLLMGGLCAVRGFDLDPPPSPRLACRGLNNNQLSGTIPPALGSLTSLTYL